ncbi:ankyrin repeat domain-containing protein [Paenibacillus sp. IHBB 10380]|uniref:ankyrin repeat domain-containing protein n=1 Tax=Paenibacillus sp. IHBB 10380 TaxID=1566358 RepID=UPI0005CF9D69|nr:ankyrin repeat domain-containing protein [Paenibacillus sp. IHBB 10380]AJS60984.1 hypothetical protein UB51_23860 [Paenibacillus sp. IHBB 10380]
MSLNTESNELNIQFLIAVSEGSNEEVIHLLNEGINVNTIFQENSDILCTSDTYRSALHLAIVKNQMELVPLLLSHGADTKLLPRELILEIITKKNYSLLTLLLRFGLPQQNNAKNQEYDLLMDACKSKNIEMVQLLLNVNLDLSIYEEDQTFLLSRYYILRSSEILTLLLDTGHYDVDQLTVNGRTLLHESLRQRYPKAALILLEKGSFSDPLDDEGYTPLYYAVKNSYYDVVKELLQREANPDRFVDGNTMLSLAASKSDFQMVELLLNYGCDPNLTNSEGKTPLQMVPRYADFMTFLFLQNYSDTLKRHENNESIPSGFISLISKS